jgi:hypothetical protein
VGELHCAQPAHVELCVSLTSSVIGKACAAGMWRDSGE